MNKITLLTLLSLAHCKPGFSANCATDADCADGLVCYSAQCTTETERKEELRLQRLTDMMTRSRAFLRARYRMTEETAAGLCIAGETAVIAVDKAHKLEFCLRPKDDTFEVGYFGPVATRVCNGALGDSEQWGDAVNHCRY